MELKVIDYETAKLAKEVGFDWLCRPAYLHDNGEYFPEPELKEYEYEQNHNHKEHRFSAPTQELLRKWLREENSVHIQIDLKQSAPTMQGFFWRGYIARMVTFDFNNDNRLLLNKRLPSGEKWSYEQALEAGLKEALKYLLDQNG